MYECLFETVFSINKLIRNISEIYVIQNILVNMDQY